MRAESHHKARSNFNTLRFTIVHQSPSLFTRESNRFFYQYVFAIICRKSCCLCVKNYRRCNIYCINLRIFHKFFCIVTEIFTIIFFRYFFCNAILYIHYSRERCIFRKQHSRYSSSFCYSACTNYTKAYFVHCKNSFQKTDFI